MENDFYFVQEPDSAEQGPYSLREIGLRFVGGTISRSAALCRIGQTSWEPIVHAKFLPVFARLPRAPRGTPVPAVPPTPVAKPVTLVALPAIAPPRRSRARWALAIAGGVLAILTVVAIVVPDGSVPPVRSRDVVILETFAALAAGDDRRLEQLAGPTSVGAGLVECESSDPLARPAEAALDKVVPLTRRTKGTKLVVTDILTELPRSRVRHDKEHGLTSYDKGDRVRLGCFATRPFRTQEIEVNVQIVEGDREFTQRVTLELTEVDGSWYLRTPPRLNVGLEVVLAALDDWRERACLCKDGGCVTALIDERGALMFASLLFDRSADLPDGALARIEELLAKRRVCEQTAMFKTRLAAFATLKDQLCACKDLACAVKLKAQMVAWRTANVKLDPQQDRDAYLANARQIAAISVEAMKCELAAVGVDTVIPDTAPLGRGTLVRILGRYFTSKPPRDVRVFFGGEEVTAVEVVSDRELLLEAPPRHQPGTVDVRIVFEPGGEITLPRAFTYQTLSSP